MLRVTAIWVAFAAAALAADDNTTVFKSDVAMSRIDAQVIDSAGKTITGLQAKDFVLRVDGKPQPIRNFASENMPVDVLLLLDVSGSMEPHVQRIADASERALAVLAPGDRVAIMVFDTNTGIRLPFRADHGEVTGELRRLLRSESFNGGTHITHALLSAASYVQREGRPDARRAIVILTDDETQDSEDEPRVEKALDEANAVLSFLRAPYEEDYVRSRSGRGSGGQRGTWGGGGGGGPWGNGGGGWPGSAPWPGGGGGTRLPGGGTLGGGDPSHSAGTADIAGDSGGDVMNVDDASSFEDTLARLRQRYGLYFYWPPGPADPEQRLVTVALSHSAGSDFANAQVRYRRAYANQSNSHTLMEVSREPDTTDPDGVKTQHDTADTRTSNDHARRIAVNDEADSGPLLMPDATTPDEISGPSSAQPAASQPTPSDAPPVKHGWPSATDSGH